MILGVISATIRGMIDPNHDGVLDDRQAHERAMALDMAEVVRELVEILGATTVAALGGVQETRAVAQWMDKREPQRPNVLRFAFQLALMISPRKDGRVARSWFYGSNPQLDDGVPIYLLRDRSLEEIQQALIAAAREFAARDGHTS